MNLKPFFSTGVSSNIYLVEDKKNLLIDAGMDPVNLTKVDILILTHSHFDHCAMAKEIQDKTGCEIWMSTKEADFFEKNRSEASAARYFDFDVNLDFKISKKLNDGDIIDLGGTKLKVFVVPGHTPGGIVLYEPESKTLFSGDTVFSAGYGRYDLMGGEYASLKESIARISKLDVKTLYPGHGPALKSSVNEYLKSIRL